MDVQFSGPGSDAAGGLGPHLAEFLFSFFNIPWKAAGPLKGKCRHFPMPGKTGHFSSTWLHAVIRYLNCTFLKWYEEYRAPGY